MEFFSSKKSLPIFLSNVKINILTFLFYKENVREKQNLFKISKSLYFLVGGHTDIILTHVLRHLSVPSEKI